MNPFLRLLALNSSRYRLKQEIMAFAATVPKNAVVLDAGAGDGPYSDLFAHARYESADFEKVDKPYGSSTYVCDLTDIPVEDCRFDCVVFTQVMEHLPEPRLVLTALHRVLKPGGRMLYTGPLFYEEHEQPYDFYRYTRCGVRHLLGSTGYVVERLDWLEGYFGTVGYQLNRMARYVPWKPGDVSGNVFVGSLISPFMMLFKVACGSCSILFHALETRVTFTAAGYPKNDVAVARKPLAR